MNGTPKHGYACNACQDWRTVLVDEVLADGRTVEREYPCPECQGGHGEGVQDQAEQEAT